MIPFELVQPRSLRKAAALLDPDDPSIRPIAGGTALMLMMKAGLFRPTKLVSLRAVEKRFSTIGRSADGRVRIGALTPLAALERAPAIRRRLPVVADTLRTLSNVRVRNVATLGGHLAHADPHMDLPPVLIALGAELVVVGPYGERTLPLAELYAGYYETVLARDELIAQVLVAPQAPRCAAYLKCTTRSADDWPALGIAAAITLDGNALRDVRLVLGAACETPRRLAAAERVLAGAARDDDAALRRAADAAADEAPVLADPQGSAPYKKQLVRVFVQRAIRKALAS
ncbi:MAG TPA: FAD binding domain-containing protein [Candidatus Sulfotelmatobacter sp.]|nr:FAD binding domain-containing protein [Candidatus Sulfotelmatobacter sp.]